MTLQAVIFAYSAIEVVGIAAGETKDARKVLPEAINGVVWRIGAFYVGSVLMLAMLLPWPFYNGDESPFVTVFSRLGIPGIGDVMNAVVLTAALSSVNSGLYSTGPDLGDARLLPAAPAPGRAARRTGAAVVPDAVGAVLGLGDAGVLVLVVVLMGFSDGAEKIAFSSIPVLAVVPAVGWRVISKRRSAQRR